MVMDYVFQIDGFVMEENNVLMVWMNKFVIRNAGQFEIFKIRFKNLSFI